VGHFGDSEHDRDLEMVDVVDDVDDFHAKFDLFYEGSARVLPEELANFRKAFLKEELLEYLNADAVDDKAGMLDALVDLVYVAVGTAHYHGFDFKEAWRRVHAANMKKVRATSVTQTKRGTLFDIVKPPGWVAPDLSDLVGE
jgi:predicted HAD superfamily Cof-like phosphohydrolase